MFHPIGLFHILREASVVAKHLYYFIEVKAGIAPRFFPSRLGTAVPLRFRERPVETGLHLTFAIDGVDGYAGGYRTYSRFQGRSIDTVERCATGGIDRERPERRLPAVGDIEDPCKIFPVPDRRHGYKAVGSVEFETLDRRDAESALAADKNSSEYRVLYVAERQTRRTADVRHRLGKHYLMKFLVYENRVAVDIYTACLEAQNSQ